MCGIVGYIGNRPAESLLLDGLKRLEYRGYDSAGIATLHEGQTYLRRAPGRLDNLKKRLQNNPALGNVGISHTRWASHGSPSEQNAHPHQFGNIALVHNGIIENHEELKQELQQLGHQFQSDTDSEILAHLIARYCEQTPDNFAKAIRQALTRVEGAYALAILDTKHPDILIGVKQACPLVVGIAEGENFLASDFPAVLSHTRQFYILDDGEMAILTASHIQITDLEGKRKTKEPITLNWSPAAAEKAGYKHFMLKEIFEQPQAVIDTLCGRLDHDKIEQAFLGIQIEHLSNIERITLIGCGTSYHAALVGKRYIEALAKIPVEVDFASEFRYRNPLIQNNHLVLGVSQSGETADTLAALKLAQSQNAYTMAVCNVLDSAIPRLCNQSIGTFYTHAGPEISVASTKAFTTQLVSLYLIALLLGKQRGTLNSKDLQRRLENLYSLPMLLEKVLEHEASIQQVAKNWLKSEHMLFMGRGFLDIVAREGALKTKEISYIHAEAYAAGEMKHGPIALIDDKMPVVVLAIKDYLYEKTLSNLEEVKSRGAQIIVLCNEDDQKLRSLYPDALLIPSCPPDLLPAVAILPLQILAYHLANLRGLDVDQPRNLAKSVTIE
ncbi:MAG: glutamine--fructose-6-phosphate transaminase (isomerizing) [Deltaproteobacteria bacterium]|nr:glutamine--fructose-6-phosphate transaminase (isomerizing) [Deltaproteobacteria bacterium]